MGVIADAFKLQLDRLAEQNKRSQKQIEQLLESTAKLKKQLEEMELDDQL